MQTLEIVPPGGTRNWQSDRFVLESRNSAFISHTETQLRKGEIKGFTLIWPTGDKKRRQRILATMQDTFQVTTGTFDASQTDKMRQDIDLVADLKVRKPRVSRAGFYVDGPGTVVTTDEAVRDCTLVTLDGDHPVQVVINDPDLGVAVLRPTRALAPMRFANLADGVPRLMSEVAVAGYSLESVLGAPTLTFGILADVKGLRGEEKLDHLVLAVLPGDVGDPVLNSRGRVLGMFLPTANTNRQLRLPMSA
ncbi:MAG: trypsin-like peptidase domain-containing protein [Rhodobacteraceae bacterium]|nr:trypsin-like peptidase domain-containing protein [Paracoccaceae bacterium]